MASHKYSYIIVLLLLSTLTFGQSSILNSPIILKPNKYSVYNILSIISKQTKLNFSYDAKIINGDSTIQITQNNTSIKKLLNKICKKNNYELINNIIIINKQNSTSNNKTNISKTQIIKINGKITDTNKDPISYATITLRSHNIGTISNIQGNFTLKIKQKYLNDTIKVNHIGFQSYKKAIKDIKNNTANIILDSKTFTMEEIIVWSGNSRVLVEQTYKLRKNNYYYNPFHISAFYREIITVKKQYKTISEGIIDVYRKNKLGFSKNQIKVIKSRKFYNYNITDSIAIKLQAGLSSVFNLDIAHQGINFFSANSPELYEYSFSRLTTLNNENVAIIKFSPKNKQSENTLFCGNLYIGIDSKALLACKFHLSRNSVLNLDKSFIFRKNRRIKAKLSSVNYFVLYSHYNNKYFLNHIFGELNFTAKHKGSLFSKKIKIRYELAVTKIDTTLTKPFTKDERTNQHRIFIEQISNNPNTFWENYNYIKPNNSIYKELTKLGVQIGL